MSKHIQTIFLIYTLLLALPSYAIEEHQFDSIKHLGKLNGIALHCKYIDEVSRLKKAIVEAVPKIEVLGEAFDQETNKSFLETVNSRAACPSKSKLSQQIHNGIEQLEKSFVLYRKHTIEENITTEVKPAIGGKFVLWSHNNQVFYSEYMLDKFHLVYFGYTFCPDICPTSLITISSALDLLGEKVKQVQPYFITLDPKRDTVKALKTYVTYFHPSLIGLTGPQEMINRVAKSYNVRFEKVEDPSRKEDDYIMDHSSGVFLMAPDGTFITKMVHGISPEDMAKRIEEALPTE